MAASQHPRVASGCVEDVPSYALGTIAAADFFSVKVLTRTGSFATSCFS